METLFLQLNDSNVLFRLKDVYFLYDEIKEFYEYKRLIYYVTNYKWLSQVNISDSVKEFCEKNDNGFLFPMSCFCSERKYGACKQECKSHKSERGCDLPLLEDKTPHKDYSISVSKCFRQKHFDGAENLTDWDKDVWIRYAFNENYMI